MASSYYKDLLFAFCFFSSVPSLFLAQPFKAVNLGNWLVTEGWMKPSLFNEIPKPNDDLLDGTQVQLLSTKLQRFLCAEDGGGSTVVANRQTASDWETFRLWRINETFFNLRVNNKQFVGLDGQGSKVVAASTTPGTPETFQIIRNGELVRIQPSNGQFLQVQSETLVTADYTGATGWEETNPSVFKMKIVGGLRGEYQITNGYGPEKAPKVMQDHWNSYITEDDFRFMSENGLNAVRVPVGWWIASDPTPPKPFVGGSKKALDNAFSWAQKYGMKVIVDLHAAQGSQNGEQHSGSRDGFLEWGEQYIQDTVAVIEFLARSYGDHPSLAAIELMNEPRAPGVSLDTLKSYYQAGYNAVRKHTQKAFVIFSNRLGPGTDSTELLQFASGLSQVAIDVHYYNLFEDKFKSMNAQQNIDFIYNDRAGALRTVTTANGPLSFVGEWTGEWNLQEAPIEDYQRFARAQMEVYGRATFGWGYWAYKCAADKWSLKWMIENNYININQPST